MTGKNENLLVVGICGAAGAGKDTFAAGIRKAQEAKQEPFLRVALADSLKHIATKIFYGEVDNDMFYSRQKKETMQRDLGYLSPREVLQRLGSAGRKLIGEDVWIESAQKLIDVFGSTEYKGVVAVPDIRYPNEVAWLRQHACSLLVRVDRVLDDDEIADEVLSEDTARHETEQHYNGFEVDLVYPNHSAGSTTAAADNVADNWADMAQKMVVRKDD